MTSSSIRRLNLSCIPHNGGAVLSANPHLLSLACSPSSGGRKNEEEIVQITRSTSLTSIDLSSIELGNTSFSALIHMASLTHLSACMDTQDVFSNAFQSSSASQHPSSLTSLNLGSSATGIKLAQMVSTHLPQLRTLHFQNQVDLSVLQPMLCLEDLKCHCSPLGLNDFSIVVSRLPMLTCLDLSTPAMPEVWGKALSASCPRLSSVSLHSLFPDRPVGADDIQALLHSV